MSTNRLGGNLLKELSWLWAAKPTCLRLLLQDILRAASRAAWTAGSSNPTKIPIIAITTKSSTSVKPFPRNRRFCISHSCFQRYLPSSDTKYPYPHEYCMKLSGRV